MDTFPRTGRFCGIFAMRQRTAYSTGVRADECCSPASGGRGCRVAGETRTLPLVRAGFSLVEVTIALGLLSFAAVAIIGILPVGLTSIRQSMNQTVEAQIVRSIAAQSVTASFTNLARTAYYDTDGQSLESASGAYYTASITTAPSVYPGSQSSPTITNSLVSLTIELIARQDPAGVGTTNTYAIQVANAGK